MKRTLTLGTLLAGISVAAGLAMLMSACSSLRDLNIINPSYSLRNVEPHVAVALPLSASTIDLDLNVGVENPNRVGLRLDQIDFGLFVNGSHLIDGTTQQGIRIPANGKGDVHIRTRIGYNEIRSIFNELVGAINGNRAQYEIRGNAYYDTPLGQMKFPLTVYSNR